MGQLKTGGGVNRTGRNKRYGKFVALGHTMVISPAWCSLSGAAIKWYIALRDRYNGSNNGQLYLSCEQAAKTLRMSKGTALRAQRELEERGFIRMTQRGGFYQRLATTWALTDQCTCTGDLPTHDWKKWRS